MTAIERETAEKQAFLAECIAVLHEGYPKLHIIKTEPNIIIRGVFPVRLEQQEIDQFLVEIIFPQTYAAGIPSVMELGNRIPRDAAHHVFVEGYLCLFVLDERWRYWNSELGIAGFFTEPLNDFFLGQLYFEQYGKYPFGERGHGVSGIFEYYAEELGTENVSVIVRCLTYLSQTEVKGHQICYCGSGQKLRSCHGTKIQELRAKIPYVYARRSLMAIHSAAKDIAKSHAAKRQFLLDSLMRN